MMLPACWLLLRALLLLGAAHSAPAPGDGPWSSPGPASSSNPDTRTEGGTPSDPGRTRVPPEPGGTGPTNTPGGVASPRSPIPVGRSELWNKGNPLDLPWKMPKTGDNSLSETYWSKTGQVSHPNPTWTDTPSKPNRTKNYRPSAPNPTKTTPPSEPNPTETDPPSEPTRTERVQPSDTYRSDPKPTQKTNGPETSPVSELNHMQTDPISEPNQSHSNPTSETNSTITDLTSRPDPTNSDSPSEPYRTETGPPSEPHRTVTGPPSEPYRTETGPPSQTHRTETGKSSEPHRTETGPSSEPHRTESGPPSQPHRTITNPSFSADIEKTQTVSGSRGRRIYYKSEPAWTEGDLGQTHSVSGSETAITQKSPTRRHVNKRTPHMDTTYISTTFTRTLLSVTNGSNMSDITEIPTAYSTAVGSDSTITESHKTVQDLGNTTMDSLVTAHDFGNTTENSGIRSIDLGSGSSAPGTYPLQTPSYLVTTYQSPTSHLSENTVLSTSDPFTAPNITSVSEKTESPSNNSSVVLSSSSSQPSSSSDSSLSSIASSFSTSTFPTPSSDSLSSFPADVTIHPNQPSSDVSLSSHIPSTLFFSSQFSITQTLSEISPNSVSTKSPVPLTTLSATSSLLSFPTLPPSIQTTSYSGESTSQTSAHIPSVSPSQTGEQTGNYTSSVTDLAESYHKATESESKEFDGTKTVRVITVQSDAGTQKMMTSTQAQRSHSVITVTDHGETSAQSTENVPSTTTSENGSIPLSGDSTKRFPQESMKPATLGSPTLTTSDINIQVRTDSTARIGLSTITPRLETTVHTEVKPSLPSTTPPPDIITVRFPPTTTTTSTTLVGFTSAVPASLCSPNPCRNGGRCVESNKGYRCVCPTTWRGDHCDQDVDECLLESCPAQTTCVNTLGSYSCLCALGYILEKGAGCVPVRTFLGHIEIPLSFLNATDEKYSRLHQIEEQIIHILNSSFSPITGYYQTTVTNTSYTGRIILTVQNIFSLSSNVTISDLKRSIQSYIKVCEASAQSSLACRLVLHPHLYYIAVSLCSVKDPGCDNETTECVDPGGVAFCQCKPGYFKYSRMDHSCRACDDGYKLQNGACVRCPFGLGGFNCSNPYQLITVIIAAAGGGILLILGITLAVTCCRKSKHDISKLIFKSGDFQMSPYAEYPKAQRSTDWGRETIEMQENGSTKNLLQMTDIYYSPGLRNSEIERNGLYPYTGLPGSRHSCIYPGQYNPTFINEENRRRDYF